VFYLDAKCCCFVCTLVTDHAQQMKAFCRIVHISLVIVQILTLFFLYWMEERQTRCGALLNGHIGSRAVE